MRAVKFESMEFEIPEYSVLKDGDNFQLHINEGEFEGISFSFSNMNIGDEIGEDGCYAMTYDLSTSLPTDEIENYSGFEKLTGNIILAILKDQLDKEAANV